VSIAVLAIIIVRLDPIAPASRIVDDKIPVLFDSVCARMVDAHHPSSVCRCPGSYETEASCVSPLERDVGKGPDRAKVRDIGSIESQVDLDSNSMKRSGIAGLIAC
jgi:hypothetical protein